MIRFIYTAIGLLFSLSVNAQPVKLVKDPDVGAGVTNWSKDTVYQLDGYVFVEAGGTLNIEAGTIIKGKASPSTGDASSALIVTRGAQIYANGTKDEPIIFTAEFDDTNDPGDLTKDDRGLWGGVLVLGNGVVGVDGGEFNVEGVPSSEGRATYGGNNNADNSGVLKYVSIRHGGSKLEANNEINGLTLAGVGSGTEIDYIEVFANLDDGIEWFGGAANVRHALVGFPGDDGYDYDQSWAGKGQFWFLIQDQEGNRGGEWDGSEASDFQPKVVPVISNCTFIGGGDATVNPDNNDALKIRDDAACAVYNSIFTDFVRRAIDLDDADPVDSWDRFMAGDISFVNNVFFDFGSGSTLDAIFDCDSPGNNTAFLAHLTANNNNYGPTGLGGISRFPDAGLDPRIDASGIAWNNGQPVGDPFFEDVEYIGAFSNTDNWALGWTALDWYGFFGDLASAVDDPVLSPIDDGLRVFPNPANEIVTISLSLETPGKYCIGIVNQLGQLLQQTTATGYNAGLSQTEIDLRGLADGIYLVTISDVTGSIVARRIIIKN